MSINIYLETARMSGSVNRYLKDLAHEFWLEGTLEPIGEKQSICVGLFNPHERYDEVFDKPRTINRTHEFSVTENEFVKRFTSIVRLSLYELAHIPRIKTWFSSDYSYSFDKLDTIRKDVKVPNLTYLLFAFHATNLRH